MKIIPPTYDRDTPPGEKRLFEIFEKTLASESWIVLHSLGIANHVTQLEGEADFVVIIPQVAILVIEVKSHVSVKITEEGYWKLGNDEPKRRSPFRQARGQVHSIRQFLRKVMPIAASSVPIFSTVWFTEIPAKQQIPKNIEWNDWELLDSSDLSDPKSSILNVINSASIHFNEKRNLQALLLSNDFYAELVNVLRPKFDVSLSSFELSKIRKTSVSQITNEQFKYLNGLKANRAGLIEGTAGTGKTFLAIETAARAISEGKSILFLCRSDYLAIYLRNMLQTPTSCFVGTLKDFSNSIGNSTKYDVLIIDEAQDLVASESLKTISAHLVNGIAGAYIRIFADYEGQKIYDVPDGRTALKNYCPDLFTFTLTENCRNLPGIGTAALFLSGRSHLAISYRRSDDNYTPELLEYSSFEESVVHLIKSYNGLLSIGFMPEEIVILCEEDQESILRLEKALAASNVRAKHFDPSLESQGHTYWATIKDFKGFDASCTIVFGLESEISNEIDPFIYVSLSRARDRLIVISKPLFFSKRVRLGVSNE
jgi:DNA replication protein DnaC